MAGIENTALTVDFSNLAFLASSKIRLERSSKDSGESNVSYVRAHGVDGHTINSTSGVISAENKNLRKFVSEFVYFNGTNSADLAYPGAIEVKIKPYGKFYTPEGSVVNNAGIQMNAAKNALKAKEPVYGMCLVTYKTPYDLYRATFGGKCPSVESTDPPANATIGSPDDDREYEGLDPMVVYAWKNGVLEASLALDPPPCQFADEGDYFARSQMDSAISKLALEVDPEYPVRYLNTGKPGLEAGCSVRVYPSDATILVKATSGNVYSVDETKRESIVKTLTFNNSSSARLPYQPRTAIVGLESVGGRFIDQYGREFIPSFRKWGDTCYSATWISKYAYQNPIPRKVDRDEIVVTNSFGVAVPCYGAVVATFVTEFDIRRFEFEYDTTKEVFKPATIVATLGKQVDSLSLSPPTSRGYF